MSYTVAWACPVFVYDVLQLTEKYASVSYFDPWSDKFMTAHDRNDKFHLAQWQFITNPLPEGPFILTYETTRRHWAHQELFFKQTIRDS
jgi:hypothetical protein